MKPTLAAVIITLAATSSAFAKGPSNLTSNADARASLSQPTIANDTIGEVLQADGRSASAGDYKLLTHDGDLISKSKAKRLDSDHYLKNNAIVVPSSTGAITTVNCPIGTSAQPNMTCKVTGNYSMERTQELLRQDTQKKFKS